MAKKPSGKNPYRYRDLQLNLQREEADAPPRELRIQFDRENAPSPTSANLAKFTWIGPDILLELGRLDPSRYHQFNDQLKAAERGEAPDPEMEIECELVARVHMGPNLLIQLANQAAEAVSHFVEMQRQSDEANEE